MIGRIGLFRNVLLAGSLTRNVVWECEIVLLLLFINSEQNCDPLSLINSKGGPNLETQINKKALQTLSADISLRRNTSNHLVKESTIVSKYLGLDGSALSGPTMST